MNRNIRPADHSEGRQPIRAVATLRLALKKRTFVVGNGNIDVGNKSPTRKAGQRCRAMSEQCGDSGRGSVSASPQKLLHLVGCRDPKIRPEPLVHLPPAAPVKR
jgi:hypothetical protein